MKTRVVVFLTGLSLGVLVFSGPVFAEEKGSAKGSMMEEKGSHKGSMMDGEITAKVTESGAIKVGNTICPLSNEKVDEMGKVVEHEHEGKIYNFCCKMCLTDFKKDPEKYIQMINDSMANERAGEVGDAHENHEH